MADPAPDLAPDGRPLPLRVDKPWGHEEIWAWTDQYVGKLLIIQAGQRLSFQYHDHKDEWIKVIEGKLALTLEGPDGAVETRVMVPIESAHVAPRRRHRFAAIERCVLIEVSTPQLDDVVRLEDDFGREGTNAP